MKGKWVTVLGMDTVELFHKVHSRNYLHSHASPWK